MPESGEKGGRPSRWSAALGGEILGQVRAGLPLRDAARQAGVGPRTLDRWLARGRAGDPAFAEWALLVDGRRERLRQARLAVTEHKRSEEARERWQRFKAARQLWWMERLGPKRFWLERLAWLEAHGKTRAIQELLARIRSEGFGDSRTL